MVERQATTYDGTETEILGLALDRHLAFRPVMADEVRSLVSALERRGKVSSEVQMIVARAQAFLGELGRG